MLIGHQPDTLSAFEEWAEGLEWGEVEREEEQLDLFEDQ